MARRQWTQRGGSINRRRILQWAGKAMLGIGLAPLVAACSIVTRPRLFNVTMSGPDPTMFLPGSLTIPRGATVIWKNDDIYPHTVTCQPTEGQAGASYAKLPQGAQPWDSGNIYTGETWSYTFTTPGDYLYYSRRDESGHMLGSITVIG
ncbi:MAG: plastocyanin/azurin family copper-binding protein [Caldilineaceae bacterium]